MSAFLQLARGNVVHATVLFTNLAGSAADPATVTFQVRNPAGAITPYAYVASGPSAVVRDAQGAYSLDIAASMAGDWLVRVVSTGAVEAAGTQVFLVSPDSFT